MKCKAIAESTLTAMTDYGRRRGVGKAVFSLVRVRSPPVSKDTEKRREHVLLGTT